MQTTSINWITLLHFEIYLSFLTLSTIYTTESNVTGSKVTAFHLLPLFSSPFFDYQWFLSILMSPVHLFFRFAAYFCLHYVWACLLLSPSSHVCAIFSNSLQNVTVSHLRTIWFIFLLHFIFGIYVLSTAWTKTSGLLCTFWHIDNDWQWPSSLIPMEYLYTGNRLSYKNIKITSANYKISIRFASYET